MKKRDTHTGFFKQIKRESKSDRFFYFFNILYLSIAGIVVLYPLLYSLACSFSSTDAIIQGRGRFVASGFYPGFLQGSSPIRDDWNGIYKLHRVLRWRYSHFRCVAASCRIPLVPQGPSWKKGVDLFLCCHHVFQWGNHSKLYFDESTEFNRLQMVVDHSLYVFLL